MESVLSWHLKICYQLHDIISYIQNLTNYNLHYLNVYMPRDLGVKQLGLLYDSRMHDYLHNILVIVVYQIENNLNEHKIKQRIPVPCGSKYYAF